MDPDEDELQRENDRDGYDPAEPWMDPDPREDD